MTDVVLEGSGRDTRRDGGSRDEADPGLATAVAERGQSLVEFALILPVLLLMLLVAVDFGRVYLGYVNLQNLARIAANFAAGAPDAWGGTPDTATQARYRDIVLNDARATNCELPGNPDAVAAPTFEDRNGDGDAGDLGDLARVQLTCSFSLITPGIAGIVGSPLAVSAEAVFPVKAGLVSTVAPPPSSGLPPVAAFSAADTDGPAPLTVHFADESGGGPTSWLWDFGDGGASSVQDPSHTYHAPGVYDVSLIAGNSWGTGTKVNEAYIFVSETGDVVAFDADRTSIRAGEQVRFTDLSSGGPTAWLWDFGDGHTSTNQNPVHAYTAPGLYDVSLTIETATGDETNLKAGYITVQDGLCKVPDFVNETTRFNEAQAKWEAAGFATQVVRRFGAPSGNFVIRYQSLVGNQVHACGSVIELGT